jgi:hypothetical protein
MIGFESAGHFRNFTGILNSALRDKRLSYRAKGILAACLSHAEGFEFTKDWIIEHGTEGRDAIISALKELRSFGYLVNYKVRCKTSGRVLGEKYKFTDLPQADVTQPELTQDRRTGNPDAGNPASGFSGRNRKPIERKPIERKPSVRGGCRGEEPLELPEWLEPQREALEAWHQNRAKSHKRAKPGLSDRSMLALAYAKQCKVLKEFCDYAAERDWQSLGFAGYKDLVDKLAKEKGQTVATMQVAQVNYTLR